MQDVGQSEGAVVNTLNAMRAEGHEQVSFFSDPSSGLRCIIAIHDTTLGPSLGGTRMWPYESETDALADVLRLSKAMTYKSAAAGLDLGGGKGLIIGNPHRDKSEALLLAYARAVDALGGRYITAEDVGTTPADLEVVMRGTRHMVGRPPDAGGERRLRAPDRPRRLRRDAGLRRRCLRLAEPGGTHGGDPGVRQGRLLPCGLPH